MAGNREESTIPNTVLAEGANNKAAHVHYYLKEKDVNLYKVSFALGKKVPFGGLKWFYSLRGTQFCFPYDT